MPWVFQTLKKFTKLTAFAASDGFSFFHFKPIYCTHQNLCMTFKNIFDFLLKFSTPQVV